MGFTKLTWELFMKILRIKNKESEFRFVGSDALHLIYVELSKDDTFVNRINKFSGDIESLMDNSNWGYEENIWADVPVKIIPCWSAYMPHVGYHHVFEKEETCRRHMLGYVPVPGFAPDHPVPDVGKFYTHKDELFEDLKAAGVTEDQITDITEVK